jgi:hypothetical protein
LAHSRNWRGLNRCGGWGAPPSIWRTTHVIFSGTTACQVILLLRKCRFMSWIWYHLVLAHLHEREVAVFEAALELPPGQREAYLEQTSRDDPELLQRVRALLQAAENGADFLAPLSSNLGPTLPAIEQPGERIGRYKLLEQIGEGGCGIVYMAAQEDPIRR